MPAAMVIPDPIAYIKIVAVKKYVVVSLGRVIAKNFVSGALISDHQRVDLYWH